MALTELKRPQSMFQEMEMDYHLAKAEKALERLQR